MHAWEAIQRVLDYLEEHLAEPHSPEELAKLAALSPFYFQRLFTRLVKRPVNEYIKLRRLAKACEQLTSSQRILDIALACGFNSHEHFTKTFKGAFGITPEDYRKQPVRLNQVMKPNLALGYTLIDENVPLVTTDHMVLEISRQTLEQPEKYLGLDGKVAASQQTPLGETTGIDVAGQLWDSFHQQKSGIKGLVPGGNEFAVSIMDEKDKESFTYFVGARAAAEATAYQDLLLWELPAAEYIVCTFEAESFEELITTALGKSINYLFTTWLPQHQLTTQAFLAEKYTSTAGIYQLALWVIPVAKTTEGR